MRRCRLSPEPFGYRSSAKLIDKVLPFIQNGGPQPSVVFSDLPANQALLPAEVGLSLVFIVCFVLGLKVSWWLVGLLEMERDSSIVVALLAGLGATFGGGYDMQIGIGLVLTVICGLVLGWRQT